MLGSNIHIPWAAICSQFTTLDKPLKQQWRRLLFIQLRLRFQWATLSQYCSSDHMQHIFSQQRLWEEILATIWAACRDWYPQWGKLSYLNAQPASSALLPPRRQLDNSTQAGHQALTICTKRLFSQPRRASNSRPGHNGSDTKLRIWRGGSAEPKARTYKLEWYQTNSINKWEMITIYR